MRIRRNASKLLGSSCIYSNSSPSPATVSVAPEPEELTICELNCSPWDLMATNPNSYCNFLANLKEEDGGISGNITKTEPEEPISAIISIAAELTLKEMKDIKGKKLKRERKKSKGKEKAAEEMILTLCKKSDGKGWRCKRAAQPPSSFCSYHLAQIRSYSTNHSHRAMKTSSAAAANSKSHQTKSAVAQETAGADSNFYYYYCGFEPWRGKRRGKTTALNAIVKEEVKRDIGSKESMDHDDDDNVIAGDDEYDLDCLGEDDDDDEDDNLYSMHQDADGNGKEERGIEKKRVVKKRGRKPIKARSLKSLL